MPIWIEKISELRLYLKKNPSHINNFKDYQNCQRPSAFRHLSILTLLMGLVIFFGSTVFINTQYLKYAIVSMVVGFCLTIGSCKSYKTWKSKDEKKINLFIQALAKQIKKIENNFYSTQLKSVHHNKNKQAMGRRPPNVKIQYSNISMLSKSIKVNKEMPSPTVQMVFTQHLIKNTIQPSSTINTVYEIDESKYNNMQNIPQNNLSEMSRQNETDFVRCADELKLNSPQAK